MTAGARYRLAIFDFDGTLADSLPWFADVINEVAEKYGFRKPDADDRDRLRSCDARQILKHLGVPLWKVPAIASHMRGLAAESIDRIALHDGVDRLLRRLSERGVALAIVTSNSDDNVRRILGAENAALIDHYGCGASIFGKPAKIRQVLNRSGVRRDEAILIGDEIRDLEAARRTRIAFGAVSWGYNRIESLLAHRPSEVFANIDEIADKIG